MGRSEEIEKAARKTIKLIRELAGYEVGSMHPNDFAVRDEEVTHDVLRLHAEHGAALWKWRWKMGRSEEIEKAARKTIKLIRELAGYEVGSMHPNDFAVRDEEVTHDVLRLHAEHGAALWKWRWKMGRSEEIEALAYQFNEESDFIGLTPQQVAAVKAVISLPPAEVGAARERRYFATPDDPGATWQEVVRECVADMEAGNPTDAWGTLKALLAAAEQEKEARDA